MALGGCLNVIEDKVADKIRLPLIRGTRLHSYQPLVGVGGLAIGSSIEAVRCTMYQ